VFPASDSARILRAMLGVVSVACLALAGWLAWHHPLAPVLAAMLLLLWSAASFLWPAAWLFVVPALLPVIDLTQWTGLLTIEEFDILVLGAAAGTYASMAWHGTAFGADEASAPFDASPSSGSASRIGNAKAARLSTVYATLIGLFALSTLAAVYRGISAAGTTDFAWADGYYDAFNSLRVAKAYLLAVLMLAPLLAALRRYRDIATGALAGGLTAGLFFTSIAILIERLAFPGLLNFSSDYRVTALFWEMHVGGAALDGFLALSLPFTIMAILSARSPARWLLAGGLILLAVYACLVTFSRGVYLAVPVSLMLLAILVARRVESWSLEHAARMLGKVCLAALFMSAMSYLTFRYGGYRALLEVLAVFAISLPLGGAGRDLPMSGWAPALGAGVLLGAASGVLAWLIPKGAYAVFALAFVCTALAVLRLRRASNTSAAIVARAAYFWLNITAAGVALNWGGFRALQDTATVLAVLMVLTISSARVRSMPWPRDLRTKPLSSASRH